jgi:hypothetical protein
MDDELVTDDDCQILRSSIGLYATKRSVFKIFSFYAAGQYETRETDSIDLLSSLKCIWYTFNITNSFY